MAPLRRSANGLLPNTSGIRQDDISKRQRSFAMLGTILLIILILLLLGALPTWGYSRSWGYGPSGLFGIIVVIIIVLWVLGRI